MENEIERAEKKESNSKKVERRSFKDRIKRLISTMVNRKDTKERIKRVTQTVIVLGNRRVGKTCVIKALCGLEYVRSYTPTVLDIYEKESMIGTSYVKFEFIDISGAYSFPAMRDLYIKKADIFFLVYDQTPDSFEELCRLKKTIENLKNRHISELPVAVIKAKCDSSKSLKERNDIDDELSRWCGTLFRCSAKNSVNINEIDDYLLSEGLFTDSRSPGSPFERSKSTRLSGRYIYGKRTKSLMLNRGPEIKDEKRLSYNFFRN